MRPWRFVLTFGVVSLLADLVYEGARSVSGPLLASLGASAVLVGLISGAGEAAALGLRLVFGPLADRTRHYWSFTIWGYAVAMVSVPLIGLTATLWVVCALVLAERAGKAIRSPAKDALLASATTAIGRGRGFAVHEAIDQIGAVAGPLLMALVIARTGQFQPAFLALSMPAAAVLILVIWLRRRVPDPGRYERTAAEPATEPLTEPLTEPVTGPVGGRASARLPRRFWYFAGFTTLTMAGFATFGVLSFHLATRGLVAFAVIPVVYAAAMGVDALAAVLTGLLYDRFGNPVLFALPVCAALVPVLAFGSSTGFAVAGCLLWGAALGIQESTMRAVVADLVGADRRATAYGVFAAAAGGAVLVGGVLTGVLYARSTFALIVVLIALQVLAFLVLRRTLRRSGQAAAG
jgi:MFS family permease